MRIFEQACFKAFLDPARSRAHYAGNKANASIKYGERGHFPAGKDDIGKAHLLDLGPGFEQAFVKPLKTPTQHDDAGAAGKLADAGLSYGCPARCHGEDGAILRRHTV